MEKVFRTVRDLLYSFRSEGHEEIETPQMKHAAFTLTFGGLDVGQLELDHGKWVFKYSREFLEQEQVKPLVGFPDTSRVYTSEDLWPFFFQRIPSPAQPEVRETIESEGLNEHDAVALLTRFGRRTISNPFVLEPAEV